MKDKDLYFRGACGSCDCQEYANDGGIKCADCKCPASRHRISYWTHLPSPKKSKEHSLRSSFNPFYWISFQWLSFQWLAIFNPFYWVKLNWTKFGWFSFPSLSINRGKKESTDYTESVIKQIKNISVRFLDEAPKLWSDFVRAIPDLTNIPDIDRNLPIVQEFQSRLSLALPTLLCLVTFGIFGFRGGHLNFPVVNELYGLVSVFLILAAASAHYVYLTSQSRLKRSLSVVLVGINSLSLLVYFLVYLGITPKLYGPLGIPIQTARFLEWNVSLPCWAQLYSLMITGQQSSTGIITRIQIFIISLLISSGQVSPICEIIGGFALSTLGTILLDLQYNYISKVQQDSHKATASTIHNIFYWSLSLIVCTWTLGLYRLLEFPETELFYSVADVGAKCAFTAVVLSTDVDKLLKI